MSTRKIREPEDLTKLHTWLSGLTLPLRIVVTKGADRSDEQNNLAFKWYLEAAEQLGDRDASNVRAHCKLYHGVKMLVTENEIFRAKWQSILMPLPIESKLALMVEPFDMPVTRQMKVSQMTRYLEAMIAEYAPMGVVFTMPEGRL